MALHENNNLQPNQYDFEYSPGVLITDESADFITEHVDFDAAIEGANTLNYSTVLNNTPTETTININQNIFNTDNLSNTRK